MDQTEEEVLLRERQGLENAHMLIDEALDGGASNMEGLSRQTQAFRGLRGKLGKLGERFPSVGWGRDGGEEKSRINWYEVEDLLS